MMKEELEKLSLSNTLNCIQDFPENNTEVLLFSKRHKFSLDDRTVTNSIASLRMHLYSG